MTKQQKLILIISILASFVSFLDGSVVGVALPAITRELGGGLILQQWVNDAYLITLGSLILVAGSLSDLFGRQRILVIGLYGFLASSLLCAIAPTGELLILARGLQGIAGALLVPSSLALIIAGFRGKAEAKAIGTWTAWTGIAFVIGPLLGGALVDLVSWRLVFAINIFPILAAVMLIRQLEIKDKRPKNAAVDVAGVLLCVVGLGGLVYGLIEQANLGWDNPLIYGSIAIGLLSLAAFVLQEQRSSHPMLPLHLFSVRNFSAGNIATFFIYAALSLQVFLLVIFLQQVAGYTAIAAGLASLPIVIIMLLLSSYAGKLAGEYGPRIFMTVGPIVAGLGTLLLLRSSLPLNYWTELLPGIVLFGLGLATTVAPLTSAILGSISSEQAGIGSAVNNAISRVAGLIAVVTIAIFIGTEINLESFHKGILLCSIVLVIGGIISGVGIRNSDVKDSEALPVDAV